MVTQWAAARNNERCPLAEPAPARMAITNISWEKPCPWQTSNSCDAMGINASNRVRATVSFASEPLEHHVTKM